MAEPGLKCTGPLSSFVEGYNHSGWCSPNSSGLAKFHHCVAAPPSHFKVSVIVLILFYRAGN